MDTSCLKTYLDKQSDKVLLTLDPLVLVVTRGYNFKKREMWFD